MTFHVIVLPDGIEQKVVASLAGVQAGKGQDVTLDSEGGAEANSPKARYLATGISVGLAFVSSLSDRDSGGGGAACGDTNNRVACGAGGSKLVGTALAAFLHPSPLGIAMGAYGASMSVYTHFIARGRDLEFPKNTATEIAIGTRASVPPPGSPQHADPH